MRCAWCAGDKLYRNYHDREWGRPVRNDRKQFEFLVLESAQAGLSWLTILRKREAYRSAYQDFNPEVVAGWNEANVNALLNNSGIIRNRRKIQASISNAGVFLNLAERYGSFSDWLWNHFDGKPLINHWNTLSEIPSTTDQARTLAAEMKKLGFSFIGPTILYAHLQATGVINDHLAGCWCRSESLDFHV